MRAVLFSTLLAVATFAAPVGVSDGCVANEIGAVVCAGDYSTSCYPSTRPDAPATGAVTGVRVDTGTSGGPARAVAAAEGGELCGSPYWSADFQPNGSDRGIGVATLVVVEVPGGPRVAYQPYHVEWYENQSGRCEGYHGVSAGLLYSGLHTPCSFGVGAPGGIGWGDLLP